MRVLIKNGTVVNADGQAKQDLLIESGIVRQLGSNISPQLPYEEIDATGCYVFPGGVDVHTHFNIDVGIARKMCIRDSATSVSDESDPDKRPYRAG